MRLDVILAEARSCRLCAPDLPHEPRPLLQASPKSRILIIGQAPGSRAHASGIPWGDQSGARLREWLALSDEVFYDPDHVALLPMGFCFPGPGKSGDLRPRPECAPMWHERLGPELRGVALTVIIGRYAFDRYLSQSFATISDAVAGYGRLLPTRIALPHPSPRNNIWLKKNPWFTSVVLPALRRRVLHLLP